MNDDYLLSVLCDELKHRRASDPALASYLKDDAIREYQQFWSDLGTHEPRPCPLCFTVRNKKVSHLIALPEKAGHEPLKCEVCKEQFHVPISE